MKCSRCGLETETEIKNQKEYCFDCYYKESEPTGKVQNYCEWEVKNEIAVKGCKDYWEDIFRVKRWDYCPHCRKPIKIKE